MQQQIDFVALSAPSIKFHIMLGWGVPKKGQKPGCNVIVAQGADGKIYQHKKVFYPHETNKAIDITKKIDKLGFIDTQYWRVAERGEY